MGGVEGFEEFSAYFRLTSGLPGVLADRLLRLYGVRAPDVLDEAGDDPSLRVPLISPYAVETGIIGAEVLYAVGRELAETLADVLLRRTMVAYGPRVALDVDRAAAKVAQAHLGWSAERAGREVREFRDYIRRYNPRDLRGIQPRES